MLAAYLQCFRNRKATEFVVQSFREHYPDAPFTLISDDGLDFSDLAKKYDLNYIHKFLNLGRQGSQRSRQVSQYRYDMSLGFNREEVLVWLERFREACDWAKESASHIIMLEDDVYVKGKININPDWQVAAGDNQNNQVSPDLFEYLEAFYKIKPNVTSYGSCGGTIFNINTFLDNYSEITRIIRDEFELMQTLDHRMGWLDFYMQILYYCLGHQFSVNPEFVETWMDVDWKDPKYTIVHQYKELY